MTVTINGTTGITTPGVVNSGTQTIASTLAVTGAITGSGLSTTLYPLVSGTAVASTSGTSIDFTSIPSWVKRITVMFMSCSTSSTSPWQIQIGTSGGVQTTGYVGGAGDRGGEGASTAGFEIISTPAAASNYSGSVILTLGNSSSGIWVSQGVLAIDVSGQPKMSAGSKTLSGTLDRVRITTVGGTDTFDAGSINILYE